jgi:hypothetical protein
MSAEIDFWRARNLPFTRHGFNAGLQAARQADALAAQGDPPGALLWLRIVHAIAELQRQQRRFEVPPN